MGIRCIRIEGLVWVLCGHRGVERTTPSAEAAATNPSEGGELS